MKIWKILLIGILALGLLSACSTEKQFPKQAKVDCSLFEETSQSLDKLSKDIMEHRK